MANTYKLRKRNLTNPERQKHPMGLEISATHENLPALGENCAERWCTLPNDFSEYFDRMWNFELRDDDVYIVTFMKSGTTWTEEAVWLLLHNMDFVKAKEMHLHERGLFLDFAGLLKSAPGDSIDNANKMESPRLIRTHMPANLLPKRIWERKPKEKRKVTEKTGY